jgi:hypothetical protein
VLGAVGTRPRCVHALLGTGEGYRGGCWEYCAVLRHTGASLRAHTQLPSGLLGWVCARAGSRREVYRRGGWEAGGRLGILQSTWQHSEALRVLGSAGVSWSLVLRCGQANH